MKGQDGSIYGRVRIPGGELLDPVEGASEHLRTFAAATDELFATDRISWDVIFGGDLTLRAAAGLDALVMVSDAFVHVAQRIPNQHGVLLLAVAPRTRSVGLVLRDVRSRVAELS